MSLDYVMVTSATRDDLADGGAGFFAETIRLLRARRPSARIEVLIPDFQGDEAALREAPVRCKVKRLDETAAARNPCLAG